MTDQEVATQLMAALINKFEFSSSIDASEARAIAEVFPEVLTQVGKLPCADDSIKQVALALTKAYIDRDAIDLRKGKSDTKTPLRNYAVTLVNFYREILTGITS